MFCFNQHLSDIEERPQAPVALAVWLLGATLSGDRCGATAGAPRVGLAAGKLRRVFARGDSSSVAKANVVVKSGWVWQEMIQIQGSRGAVGQPGQEATALVGWPATSCTAYQRGRESRETGPWLLSSSGRRCSLPFCLEG